MLLYLKQIRLTAVGTRKSVRILFNSSVQAVREDRERGRHIWPETVDIVQMFESVVQGHCVRAGLEGAGILTVFAGQLMFDQWDFVVDKDGGADGTIFAFVMQEVTVTPALLPLEWREKEKMCQWP